MATAKPKAVLVEFGAQSAELEANAARATKGLTGYLAHLGYRVEVLDADMAHAEAEKTCRAQESLRFYELGKSRRAGLIVWGLVGPMMEEWLKSLKEQEPDARLPDLSIELGFFDFRTGQSFGRYWPVSYDELAEIAIEGEKQPPGLCDLPEDFAQRNDPPRLLTWDECYANWEKFGALPEPVIFGLGFKPESAEISTLTPGAPAETAGLQVGDVILRMNGQKIGGFDELVEFLKERKPGDALAVEFLREGKTQNVQVTLAGRWRFMEEQRRGHLDKPAPDFEATTLDGPTIRLSGLRGKVVVLDFWATWCGPCRQQMPTALYCHENFAGQGLVVLSISHDSDEAALREYVKENRLPWPQVLDRVEKDGEIGPIGKLYEIDHWPLTVVVDRSGTIRDRDSRGEDLVRSVRYWLKKVGDS